MASVYLLHFDAPLDGASHPQHYLGWAGDSLTKRLKKHANGNGACIIANGFIANGIGFTLVRTWPNATRHVEASLKRQHNPSRFCPLCTGRTRGLVVRWQGEVVHKRARLYAPRLSFRYVPSEVNVGNGADNKADTAANEQAQEVYRVHEQELSLRIDNSPLTELLFP